jgi:hypothetical protein
MSFSKLWRFSVTFRPLEYELPLVTGEIWLRPFKPDMVRGKRKQGYAHKKRPDSLQSESGLCNLQGEIRGLAPLFVA